MPSGGHFRVRNHVRFQHYKDRSPQWIKLHASCMTDLEFSELKDHQKYHAIGMAIMASQTDNHTPADAAHVRRIIGAKQRVDFQPLVTMGFLEVCRCKRCIKSGASDALAERFPAEKRESKKREPGKLPEIPESLDTPAFKAAWAEWLKFRRQSKAVTARAAVMQFNKLERVGSEHAIAAIQLSISNDWQGLFPEKLGKGAKPKSLKETQEQIFGHSSQYDEKGKYRGT